MCVCEGSVSVCDWSVCLCEGSVSVITRTLFPAATMS